VVVRRKREGMCGESERGGGDVDRLRENVVRCGKENAVTCRQGGAVKLAASKYDRRKVPVTSDAVETCLRRL